METQGLHQEEARFLAPLTTLQGTTVLPLRSADTHPEEPFQSALQAAMLALPGAGCQGPRQMDWDGDCQAQLVKV